MNKIRQNSILIFSISIGILLCFLDGLFDYLFFYSDTFLNLLLLNIPSHEIYIRLSILLTSIIAGVFLQYQWKKKIKLIKNAQKKEAEIQSIFRAAPVGIGVVVNRKITKVNQFICTMLGYEPHELLEHNAALLYPDIKEYEFVGKEKYRQILDHGTGSVETHFKRKDGKIIDVILSSTPIDFNNLEKGVTFIALDITEKKAALKELEESVDRFQKIFEKTNAIMLLIDPENGKIIDANKAALKFYHYSIHDFREKLFIQDINILTPVEIFEEMGKARAGNKQYFNFKHKLANKEIKDVEVYSSKIKLQNKEVLFSIVHDISERLQANEEIKQYRNHLEEMVKVRTTELENKYSELSQKNAELEKYNELFIKREFRIKELKKEIETLQKELKK